MGIVKLGARLETDYPYRFDRNLVAPACGESGKGRQSWNI